MTLTLSEDECDAVIVALARLRRDTASEDGYDDDFEEDRDSLSALAGAVLDRIEALLPVEPAGPAPKPRRGEDAQRVAIRKAIHAETKLILSYTDRKDRASDRTIWPIELGFVGAGETVGAWCESRRDFRHFRLDRIRALKETGERYPERRRILRARLRLDEADSYF